jgi:hypothetical protein
VGGGGVRYTLPGSVAVFPTFIFTKCPRVALERKKRVNKDTLVYRVIILLSSYVVAGLVAIFKWTLFLS